MEKYITTSSFQDYVMWMQLTLFDFINEENEKENFYKK